MSELSSQAFGEILSHEPINLDDALQVSEVAARLGISLSWLGKHYDEVVRAARLFRRSHRIVQPKTINPRTATKLYQRAFERTTTQLLQEIGAA